MASLGPPLWDDANLIGQEYERVNDYTLLIILSSIGTRPVILEVGVIDFGGEELIAYIDPSAQLMNVSKG